MTPIGVAIGWGISTDTNPLLEGIFNSIAAGTFVYVGTMEVIVEEFSSDRLRGWKFLAYLVAIGFVCSFFFLE